MQLAQLCEGIAVRELGGDPETEITDLAYDSRRVGPGSIFFCVSGMSTDGHDFAAAAVDAGAAALVVERPLGLGVAEIVVESARDAMAPFAARFFGDPTARLAIAAVTGTNGKTTSAFLVRSILEAEGRRCGLLGTIKQVVGGEEVEAVRTTPEAIDLQRTFAAMLAGGDQACVMEISSHALVLGRADGVQVAAAAFTNLSQDHLDFHDDMEDYYAAKRVLFTGVDGRRAPPRVSAINIDDEYGRRLAAELVDVETELVTFSAAGAAADLRAREVEFDASGSRFVLEANGETRPVALPLPGHFNVENALAALALVQGLGTGLAEAIAALRGAEPVPGRLEPIAEGQPFAVLVDYAHTPDSLENVLGAARRLGSGRLISVLGCGGDRDRSKRPLMGRAGAELSDLAVITSDNPRSEAPAAILQDILSGIDDRDGILVEVDRRKAIALAFSQARPGDLVVIAGKGHEQGQEFEHGRKIPFDDRVVAREQLRAIGTTA
ncbi:MAG: UDP-N-acetylmuramoyl-L-alanyl-D-glutamate--2,6-diaminopimelate ligase [Solirubrobacterales bacterium]